MVRLIYGKRIAKNTEFRVSVTAIIFDELREKVLLTQRSDNGRWCLPGGGMDPGESAEEACARETFEETGLEISVTRLIGIYTSPDVIIEYADGNQWQSIGMNFEAQITGGGLRTSNETIKCGYFSVDSFEAIDLMENQLERIQDALENLSVAIIK